MCMSLKINVIQFDILLMQRKIAQAYLQKEVWTFSASQTVKVVNLASICGYSAKTTLGDYILKNGNQISFKYFFQSVLVFCPIMKILFCSYNKNSWLLLTPLHFFVWTKQFKHCSNCCLLRYVERRKSNRFGKK